MDNPLINTLPLILSDDVAMAETRGIPIVALESTIITHGMEWPANLETAKAVEAAVREAGAVPATIAVIGGQLHVGLSHDLLETLARTKDARKLSRSDIAHCLASGETGSTTVAATMLVAHLAGISVFATGGIGGVHRGAETDFDISADLLELARTPVIVVSAGAKAILDLPKTLEYLETQGVPVVGFDTDEMPAFWSRSSGLPLSLRANSPKLVAQTFRMHCAFGGGMLLANPIPKAAEIARDVIEPIIQAAVQKAQNEGIKGKAVTPFLLKEVVKQTEGASLAGNRALILNNARLAAEVATALQGPS